MTKHDYDFLRAHDLRYHEIYERGNVEKTISDMQDGDYKMNCLKKYKNVKYTFYDDSKEIINKFSNYKNVNMVDAIEENRRLKEFMEK
jgi:hypothetical protein